MSDEAAAIPVPAIEASVEPLRAAGILLTAPDGRILLMRRTDGAGWAFPGGGIEEGESAEGCARREFTEETGSAYEGELKPWTRRIKDGVDFTTFLAGAEAFVPTLNEEHDLFTWAAPDVALTLPLHPGARVALQRFGMHELDIAKAMAAGDLVSPQRYANLMLVAIRITGTGVTYRPTHKEFPWRDPALYLTQEFLERCNGLPVILQHPKKGMLNTKEFRDRIVGTIFLPYIDAAKQEVWAIAKILDMEVAEMLETEKMSTSPGVICDGTSLSLKDGKKLLIEAEPELLDHIALLYARPDGAIDAGVNAKTGAEGVWDKGLGLAGIDSVDATPIQDWEKLDLLVRRTKLYKIRELLGR